MRLNIGHLGNLAKDIDQNCVTSVRIWSFFGPHSVRMRENTDQKNSEYIHFSKSAKHSAF